jgi:hypothetical protein
MDSVEGTSFDDYYAAERERMSPEVLEVLEEAEAYYQQVNEDLERQLAAKRAAAPSGSTEQP